jgi:collagenase-like PrtC family protease
MCKLLYRVFDVTSGEQKEITFTNMLDAYTFCSFCVLPALVNTGVTGFKIVGREMSLAYQEAVTRTYRELLDLIEQDQIEVFQKMVSAQRSEARGVWFEGLPQSPCDQQRCYYSPIFHAPYKNDAPQRSTPY